MKMFQSNKGFSETLINKDFLKIRKRKKCLPLAFNYSKRSIALQIYSTKIAVLID